MKNSRMKVSAMLLAAVFSFTGCGDALYEMTPEEEAAIVSYASHAVAKFNTYQKDGQVYVEQEDQTAEETEQESENTETENTESVADLGTQSSDNAAGELPQEQKSTLTDALDLGVIQADCVGTELCSMYPQTENSENSILGQVVAEGGKQLLVVHVNLHNQYNQKLLIDILKMKPTFRATVNGSDTIAAQVTLLPNDLGTYQSEIDAGATNETVLVFEVPQDIQEISGVQLKVTMNGNNYTVDL